MWILNICVFASTSENEVLIFYFKKIILKIEKELLSTVYVFVFFYKKFMSKQRIPPFYTIPPFSPTLPFLEKIFHPHPYCQIRGSQSPLKRRSLNNGYVRQHLFLKTTCINLIFLHNHKKQTQMFNQNHSLALHSI